MRRFDRLGRLAPLTSVAVLACASGGGVPIRDDAAFRFIPAPADLRVAEREGPDPAVFGGLWTFESPPFAIWEARYGTAPRPEVLAATRAASARIGEYCSGAVVSPEGHVLTTQSCVLECIAASTPPGRDDVAQGVMARSAAQERLCPGLYIDLPLEVTDVTKSVETAVLRSPESSRESARRAAITRLEQECGARPGRACEVVELWNGARLHLYAYRRITTVKLVFAPPLRVATAGGGGDHLAWPRHSLDFALLRAWERDGRAPASTPQFLRMRVAPLADGEPVLVAGSPISSQRLASTSQLVYEREVRLPQNRDVLSGLAEVFRSVGDEMERQRAIRGELYNVSGSLDQIRLHIAALRDSLVTGARLAWEREVQRLVNADPDLARRYADLWDRLAAIQVEKARISPRLNAANVQVVGVPHFIYAIDLGRYARALALPEEQRPPELRGAAAEELYAFLRDESYLDGDMARRFLAVYLGMVRTWLEPHDPLRAGLLRPDESPDSAAARLTRASPLLDPEWRARILDGGAEALAASDDPLLRHALLMDTTYAELLRRFQDLLAREWQERRRLGEAALIAFGETFAPDATFSPRITDGVVRGYRRGFDVLPAQTTFYGLFERDHVFGHRPDWTLPPEFDRQRDRIDLATPLNFVITADAFGSGSAVIDRDGRLTGIVIGTNARHVANRFAFVDPDGRAVAVHAAAIVEALSAVYRAQYALESLTIEKESE